MRKAVKALISYSHKDEEHRQSLLNSLSTAIRNKELEIWSDHCIRAGQEIDDEILAQLKEADLVFLLVSQDFIASDYCYRTELEIALERHANERCVVMPIVVRPTDLDGVPFQRIKMLPHDARAVSTWSNIDEAWLNVAKGIREAIKLLPPEPIPEVEREEASTEIRHHLSQSFDILQTRYSSQARPGVSFNFAELDDLADGIWPGETAIIASRPEHGHIELTMAAILHSALEGKRITVLSQRMAGSQYSTRLMCALGLISRARLSRGWLEDEDWKRVTSAIRMLRDAKLKIEDEPIRSSEDLISKLAAISVEPNELLVVDGLEYISNGSVGQERSIALALSDYGRHNKVAVIATLTLGSEVDARALRQPLISDMGEWQAIEPYCSKIIFCYRDDLYLGENSSRRGILLTLVAKSTDGLTGSVELRIHPEYGAVLSLEEHKPGKGARPRRKQPA